MQEVLSQSLNIVGTYPFINRLLELHMALLYGTNQAVEYIDFTPANDFANAPDTFYVNLTTEMLYLEDLAEAYQQFLGTLGGSDFDIMETDWPLSSGEKSSLDMFSRIYYAFEIIKLLYKKEEKTVYLFLDEAETSFHPEWQRRFIYNLIQFLDNVLKDSEIKVQVFIASHSPLLVSDLPKENIIFLKSRGKEENNILHLACLEKAPQTFAANLPNI
jgi:hypothetical protein